MSALVPHFRPTLADGAIRASEPVGAIELSTLGAAANWINGHGSQLVPWCAIGETVGGGASATYDFRVKPKAATVERVWLVNLRATETNMSVVLTPTGGSAVTVFPLTSRNARRSAFEVTHQLSAKSSAETTIGITVAPTGGAVVVESIACYEQTRRVLRDDTTDYGVDLTSLRPRQPIVDVDNKHPAGVADGYKNADARRAGHWYWSTGSGSPISPGSTSLTDLFVLYPQVHGALTTPGSLTSEVTVAAYARINITGSTDIRFDSVEWGSTRTLSVTSNGTYAWVSGILRVNPEDLTVADGRRDNAWESVRVRAADPSGGTLEILALSIFRGALPL